MFSFDDESTICALSTPPGTGGIAVVRVSGRDAFRLTRMVCPFLPAHPESHRIYFGTARENESGEPIDELLVSCFADGRSFTGEETTEISCHGSPAVSASVLSALVEAGCRMAGRGEFSFRAFMNGRLDLVQAEGILGLVESQSKQAARVALRQLKGQLSRSVAEIEDGLIWILAQLEASIDFSPEGIEVVPSQVVLTRTLEIQDACSKLIQSYRQGRILRDGLMVALVGRPNVGKSSLLNVLVGEERAIVTATPGTTRDLVEGRIAIHGVPVTIVDSAGLRDTTDEVEQIGIQRARELVTEADLVFHVLEAGRGMLDEEKAELRRAFSTSGTESAVQCVILNKVDQISGGNSLERLKGDLRGLGLEIDDRHLFVVSATKGTGLEAIREFLLNQVRADVSETSAVVTQARHFEVLEKIHSCLERALALIKRDESAEFIAFELQDSIHAVHGLLGKEFDEQVIDRIFKEFCIGK